MQLVEINEKLEWLRIGTTRRQGDGIVDYHRTDISRFGLQHPDIRVSQS